jgi:hypothetical protein
MYEKSIILTRDKRLEHFIKNLLRNKKKSFETTLPLLTDMEAIREDIQKIGTTQNVRREFGFFIKGNGFPYMFVMDYQADFSLPFQNDPDKRKLVRTFMLAYALLAHGKGFESAVSNIVFIIEKESFPDVSRFVTNPASLLEQIRTRDDRINAIIDSFVKNREKANDFYRLSYIFKPLNGKYSTEIDRLEEISETFNQNIASRKTEEALERPQEKRATEMIEEDVEPADIICRATLEKVIVNGEVRDIRADEKNSYLEKNIHIIGAATQRTLPTVKERIIDTFNLMAKLNPFKKDERIFIKIPDSSKVDGAFAISMGSFLAKELAEYEGISLEVGSSILEKLKNSEGYFAVEDFIIKNL